MSRHPRASFRVRIAGDQGHTLAGIVDRPEDRPDAPIALFSPCFTCSKDLKAIVRISRMLAQRGVAVLRFDMRGLGDSEGDFSESNFTTNLADLRAAARFAAQTLAAPSLLIGHSFGGAASLAAAALGDPSLSALRGVVTLAAPADTTHLAQLLTRMDPEIETRGVGSVSIGGRSWTIRRQMVDDFRTHRLPDLISQLALPLMVFHSPSDETVPYDQALRIMQLASTAANGQDADASVSLITLTGANHLLTGDDADLTYVADLAAAFAHRLTQS